MLCDDVADGGAGGAGRVGSEPEAQAVMARMPLRAVAAAMEVVRDMEMIVRWDPTGVVMRPSRGPIRSKWILSPYGTSAMCIEPMDFRGARRVSVHAGNSVTTESGWSLMTMSPLAS